MSIKPKGSAAVPFNKKKVAVFGSGGSMGATMFGFIQRASSIYGTGLGGVRCICATPTGSANLNKILGRSFKLAFAGEDMVRLTNMQDKEAISRSLNGMDAAVLGTIYQMEQRNVALNSYEKSPNDKTYEFYLDDQYAANWDISADDIDYHLEMFQRSIDACKTAELEHIVVIETPYTKDPKPFAKIIDDAGIPFTYIRVDGKLENTKLYTFEEGVQSSLEIDSISLPEMYSSKNGYASGDWSDYEMKVGSNDIIAREDIAALAVQSLLSLDWSISKCLKVVSSGTLLKKMDQKQKNKMKSDKDWCIKSEVLAETLMEN